MFSKSGNESSCYDDHYDFSAYHEMISDMDINDVIRMSKNFSRSIMDDNKNENNESKISYNEDNDNCSSVTGKDYGKSLSEVSNAYAYVYI
jgi:hypothetical protein